MPEQFNRTRAALILADASLTKDRLAADRHGISVRSIEDWRRRLKRDPQLRQEYDRLIAARDWSLKIPNALASAIAYIERASSTPEITPELVTAISGAISTLNEVMLVQAALEEKKSRLQQWDLN